MAQKYDPIGFCIYCGKSGPSVKLGDEHIIPYGLGGRLVLPDTSCKDCEKIIGAYVEHQILRRMLGDIRTWRRIKRRKRKKPYKPAPMLIDINGELEEHDVPASEDRLNITAMCSLHKPRILEGKHPLAYDKSSVAQVWLNIAIGKTARENTLRKFPNASRINSIASFHPELFARMLGKIGHSFAVAEIGLDHFKPLLRKAILGEEMWNHGYYVGGEPNPIPPSKYSTELGLRRLRDPKGKEYVVARIRLFGDLGAPVYYAVVGEL